MKGVLIGLHGHCRDEPFQHLNSENQNPAPPQFVHQRRHQRERLIGGHGLGQEPTAHPTVQTPAGFGAAKLPTQLSEVFMPGIGSGGIPGITGGLHGQLFAQKLKGFGRGPFSSSQTTSEMPQHRRLHRVTETVEITVVHDLLEVNFAEQAALSEEALVQLREAGERKTLGADQQGETLPAHK